MNVIKKILAVIAGITATIESFAQEATAKIEMADALRKSGKIYVVVAVLVTIFLGIIVYLAMIDRKISKLEKEEK